jgi:hypothetical protein
MAEDGGFMHRRRGGAADARPRPFGRKVERDFSVLDHQHTVGGGSPLRRRRASQKGGRAAPAPPAAAWNAQGIQGAERLVEGLHARPADQRPGEDDSLLLSAGQSRSPAAVRRAAPRLTSTLARRRLYGRSRGS